jgi:hypothetical protein
MTDDTLPPLIGQQWCAKRFRPASTTAGSLRTAESCCSLKQSGALGIADRLAAVIPGGYEIGHALARF